MQMLNQLVCKLFAVNLILFIEPTAVSGQSITLYALDCGAFVTSVEHASSICVSLWQNRLPTHYEKLCNI